MRFRQYDVSEKKYFIVEVFMTCFLSYKLFWLIFVAKSYGHENWIFVAGIIIFGYSLFNSKTYITVDEKGILCERKGKIKWKFTWDEISHLKKTRNPARANPVDSPLEIVLTDEARMKNRELLSTIRPVFQYGEKARKALKMYCQCEIIQ